MTRNKFHHEECNGCEHPRHCINGEYCMLVRKYIQYTVSLPCGKNKKGGEV